jgi:predicted AlkP superfamily pyrophosphatase or phosphodiesterase
LLASVWRQIGHEPLSVLGSAIADSTFSTYARGGTARAGYRDVADAVQIVARHVRQAERPTLTYLYLPQFDAICHKEGTESPQALALLEGLEAHLRSLADEIAGRARIVITADHGLINTPPERTFILEHDDPIVSHLVCPPTGEPTMPYFHVKPGSETALVDSFMRRFGDAFVFLTPDEAEQMHVFGPGPLSPVTRRRLGNLIAIARQPAALYFRPRQGAFHLHAAVHAGLTPEEMLIPLILA